MINNLLLRTVTSFFLIVILSFGLFFSERSWKILLIIFSILCFLEFYSLIKKIFNKKIYFIISVFLISVYLIFFNFFLVNIRINFGVEIILILLLACIFSDMGGYIFGKLIGGPKLSRISPKKTISGAFGSIIFTVIGTSLCSLYLVKIDENSIVFELSIKFYIWLVMMSLISQIGDLFFSYLKRKANVKDTGNILPGHGGMLDRVDGIIFAIPIGFIIYLTFVNY